MEHTTLTVEPTVKLNKTMTEISNSDEDEFLHSTKKISLKDQDIIWSWNDVYDSYTNRYNRIVDELNTTLVNLQELILHVSKVKIPYCWEFTRVAYTNELNELLVDLQIMDGQISTFTREMDMHKRVAIVKADKRLSEKSISYLDTLLNYYAERSDAIKEDLETLRKVGIEAYVESQQIVSQCGDLQ